MTPHLLRMYRRSWQSDGGLPRTRGSLLRLRPWTPWIWGILDFRSIRVIVLKRMALRSFQFGNEQFFRRARLPPPPPFAKFRAMAGQARSLRREVHEVRRPSWIGFAFNGAGTRKPAENAAVRKMGHFRMETNWLISVDPDKVRRKSRKYIKQKRR